MFAFVLAGETTDWIGPGRAFDFYDGKGAVQSIFEPWVGP